MCKDPEVGVVGVAQDTSNERAPSTLLGCETPGRKEQCRKRPKWLGHCRVCAKYSALVWFILFVSCCPKSHRCCLSFRRFTVQPKSREAKRGKAGSLQLKTGGPEPLGGGQQVTVCSREKEETNSNAGTQCSGDRGQQICP